MDAELVVRAQAGDEEAFTALAYGCGDRLRRVAFGILRDRQLADDAAQAAMLRIWRKLPRLRDPERFDAWAYRIVVNACSVEARRTPTWLPGIDAEPDRGPVAADGTDAVDDRDELERGFRRLSVDQRAVVVLHHLVGLPVDEVADILGIPSGTARSRLDRAMARLRVVLRAGPGPVALAPSGMPR
jgi:RNA polymerase sigma factor (sigma-70 family)